jgi:hypothetical protein
VLPRTELGCHFGFGFGFADGHERAPSRPDTPEE